jgi:hypothetical protein
MDELKQQLRIDKLVATFKMVLCDFPVMSHSDARGWFPGYSDDEFKQVVERLLAEKFMTISHGKKGGVRYVRSLAKE